MAASSKLIVDFIEPMEEATPQDYVALLKPRVMSLVVFTGWVGLFLSPGMLHPFLKFIAILCIALGSGAAGAINMWYDADIDALMLRTRQRPIPAGRIQPQDALTFGVMLASASVLIMGLAVNWTAAALLAFSIFFYVFIYTIWLKRRTPQNIVIGGAAGALPPMIGWAAVTGDVSLASFILFLIVFMWTPPHFWALSLYQAQDYTAANVPMLPVIAGKKSTKRHIFLYTLFLLPVALLPYFLHLAGKLYFIGAFSLSGLFIFYAFNLYRKDSSQEDSLAKKLFRYSIFYLFGLFLLLVVDKVQ